MRGSGRLPRTESTFMEMCKSWRTIRMSGRCRQGVRISEEGMKWSSSLSLSLCLLMILYWESFVSSFFLFVIVTIFITITTIIEMIVVFLSKYNKSNPRSFCSYRHHNIKKGYIHIWPCLFTSYSLYILRFPLLLFSHSSRIYHHSISLSSSLTFIIIHQFLTYFASSVIIFSLHTNAYLTLPTSLCTLFQWKYTQGFLSTCLFIYICMVGLGMNSVIFVCSLVLLDILFARFCCVSICIFVL